MPEYLIDPDICFLNHGSFGACPREVLDEQHRFRTLLEREPVDFLDRTAPERLNQVRIRAAQFLGANAEDLVFVPNATSGINAVLTSFPPKAGSEVLTSNHRYDAVAHTLRRAVEFSGAKLIEAQVPFPLKDPQQIIAAFEAAITPQTSMMVIDHITSPTALIFPVDELITLARQHQIPILIDGAHAPGQVTVNLNKMRPDWWVGNLHKWVCAPKGVAVLWTAPLHQSQMRNTVTSHGMGKGYHEEFDWPGTFDPTAIMASVKAMDLHDEMGGLALRNAHHALVREGRELLANELNVALPHPDDPRLYGSMATLPCPIPRCDEQAIRDRLFHEYQIEVPVLRWGGESWFRISGFAGYNKPDDYQRLASAFKSLQSTH